MHQGIRTPAEPTPARLIKAAHQDVNRTWRDEEGWLARASDYILPGGKPFYLQNGPPRRTLPTTTTLRSDAPVYTPTTAPDSPDQCYALTKTQHAPIPPRQLPFMASSTDGHDCIKPSKHPNIGGLHPLLPAAPSLAHTSHHDGVDLARTGDYRQENHVIRSHSASSCQHRTHSEQAQRRPPPATRHPGNRRDQHPGFVPSQMNFPPLPSPTRTPTHMPTTTTDTTTQTRWPTEAATPEQLPDIIPLNLWLPPAPSSRPATQRLLNPPNPQQAHSARHR